MLLSEFISKLKLAHDVPNYYNNHFPKNCGYYDGSKFSFDCWNLIKAILGGWTDNRTVGYYVQPKDFPTGDVDGYHLLMQCTNRSKDFSKLKQPGTYLYLSTSPHAGVYVGDFQYQGETFNVVECTGAWEGKVQYTYVDEKGGRYLYKNGPKNQYSWTDYGLLPYVEYDTTPAPAPAPVPQPTTYKDDKFVWDRLNTVINNDYGVAGLMGNLQAESGVRSNNLENSYEKKLGMSDEAYMTAVDNGSYTNFVHDSAGYGLAQWTYWTRKQNLLSFAKAKNASIADLAMQVDFLLNELGTYYKGVLTQLQTATSVQQASDVVLTQFERPKNQSDAAKQQRAALGMSFYNKYAGTAPTPAPTLVPTQDIQAGDTVRITNESLINMLTTNYAAMLRGPLKVSAVNGEVATIALTPFDISVNDLLEIGAEAQLVAVTPYIVQVKRVLPLNVYAQPKDGAKVNTTINSAGTYTIVAQTTDNKYGQLKSGAGFVRLADVDRV